jgi:ATP-dependent Clp protease protease subunit
MDVLLRTSNGITQVSMEAKQLSRRIITICGKITEDVAVDFFDKMLDLNMESEEPITVLINTEGGEINNGLMAYDAIVGSRAPVRMICRGKAYSMGAVLFACANERLMLPNSELMLHQPLLGGRVSGNASSIKSISDSLLETREKMNKLLASHTGKTVEEIAQATDFDHYFSPDEAIAFGLCDRVVNFADVVDFANGMEDD